MRSVCVIFVVVKSIAPTYFLHCLASELPCFPQFRVIVAAAIVVVITGQQVIYYKVNAIIVQLNSAVAVK